MRNISSAALDKLTAQFGAEPVNIIEVQWSPGGSRYTYADREIDTGHGRILELSPLENVVNAQGGSASASLSLTLDDSDGTIKDIFKAHDIHKRPVWVYQWFQGLDLGDKFLIFRGQINSPVVWDEGARTIRFDVVTKVEDTEIGFSAEEGTFANIPDSLIGKPWPMAFGTVLDMPTIALTKAITGTTQQGVGIVSGKEQHGGAFGGNNANRVAIGRQLALMSAQVSALALAGDAWRGVDGDQAHALQSQANQIRRAIAQTAASLQQAELGTTLKRQEDIQRFNESEGPSVINILGGEDFPQGVPVEVEIGSGGFFTGIFDCQEFRITSRRHLVNDERSENAYNRTVEGTVGPNIPLGDNSYDIRIDAPGGPIVQKGNIISPPITRQERVDQIAQHYWADAGSRVSLTSDAEQHYIVSIVPGTVLAVKAYKHFEGIRRLVNVPSDLWEQIDVDYDAIQAVTVKLTKQLSGIPDQGWEDDLYVTFESDVGPNTVDIMEYLIDTYSDLSTDSTSFDAVKTKLEPFPSSFALFDRPQILDALRDIAFQARCAVFVKDETVYLKYLPSEPTSDESIGDSDVANQSITVTLTPTEELVTKMVVKWRPTYAEDDERKIILRHNVEKYGVQEEEFDWSIYNQPDIIRKAATFWLIRKANTWKRINFSTYLDKLRLETFDTATIEMSGDLVASDDVKAIVEQADYNSAENTIDFQCLVPVKAGSMEPYKFFWPETALGTFPAPGDFGGGGNVGEGATGELPVISIDVPNPCDSGGIFIGGPNIIFAGPADRGDPTPADIGFEAQAIIPEGTDFELVVSPNPNPDLGLSYTPDIPVPALPPLPAGVVIDIASTPVVNGSSSEVAHLSSVFRTISNEELVIDAEAKIGDGANEGQFDFQFDDETGQFGAGTAFLAEE